MGALTVTASNELLDHLNLVGAYTPTSPLKLRLMTANGSASSAGTEVAGGSYAPQTISFSAASGGSAASAADVTFAGMPAATIVGAEVWDSASSPVRLWWGALTSSRTLLAGDDLKFPASSILTQFT